jgi:hypothetical protein
LSYETGEEIRQGDHVQFHGNAGRVELVVDPHVPDQETKWYLQEYGQGVMVIEPAEFGRACVTPEGAWENLVFVSRQEGGI